MSRAVESAIRQGMIEKLPELRGALYASRRVILLEAVVKEAVAHIEGLLTIDTARYGARAWLRDLPGAVKRTHAHLLVAVCVVLIALVSRV